MSDVISTHSIPDDDDRPCMQCSVCHETQCLDIEFTLEDGSTTTDGVRNVMLRYHVVNSAEVEEWRRTHVERCGGDFDIPTETCSPDCYGVKGHTYRRGCIIVTKPRRRTLSTRLLPWRRTRI